ncbi:elongation factor 1-beta-like [Mizuhopecten yessoensis]|uniref:Elongation factor 1-beta n=1 Tax=Mizuhopecten yessoensis TaxID=6573 RepID=A0A210PQK9_MIZYE|nr:elongation factor 1-beta-like [Mizuhopecten yessoensis]OWF38742.1 Elongation factor 1-beta [Mizuhopecten yessoensis]
MGFGDLKSRAGQQALDAFVTDKSYIEGYQPSQADVVVFNAVSKAPNADLPHALRWFNHIKSYSDAEKKGFGGQKKDVGQYGPSGDAKAKCDDDDEEDDDIDLFGSDSEEEEDAKALKEKRLAEYAAKKAKKPAVIAKSSIVLDIKPLDDETDMADVEKKVRTIVKDGLLWGTSKLIPVAFGIKKLQISMVVEDAKVSVDDITEKIETDFEDFVQSVDIHLFQKI